MSSLCSNLTHIAGPELQCEYARNHCQLNSLVPYELVYCLLSSTLARALTLLIVILLTFAAMGVAAFDYLSPNLTHVAEVSGLSESLMGVTVLAFGNGSVDVFSALVALNANEGGMAFGEIMGGALFVGTVVIGSMAIIKPFQIDPHFTLRDTIVLGLSVLYNVIILSDGTISLTEALLGLCMYAMYAVFVVHQHLNSPHKHSEHRRGSVPDIPSIERPLTPEQIASPTAESLGTPYTPLRPSLYSAVDLSFKVTQKLEQIEARSRNPSLLLTVPSTSEHQPYLRRVSAPDAYTHRQPPHMATSPRQPVSQSAVASPELAPISFTVPSETAQQSLALSGASTSPSASSMPRPRKPAQLPKLNTLNVPANHGAFSSQPLPAQPLPTQDDAHDHSSHHSAHHHQHAHKHFKDFSLKHLVDDLLEYKNSISPSHSGSASPTANISNSASPSPANTSNDSSAAASAAVSAMEIASIPSESIDFDAMTWTEILFPSLVGWSKFGLFHRTNAVLTLPIMTLLVWSIPLSSYAESRRHIALYTLVVPSMFPAIMPNMSFSSSGVVLQCICIGAGLSWWAWLKRPLPSSLVVAGVGFFMGLLWVLVLATELVAVLKILGTVCHVSDTMMGLTVFALGDSLGDFVSNITVARIGFPTMAISACIGGPIFTLLVGISGASLCTMLSQRQLKLIVPVAPSLLLSGFGLILAMVVFAVSAYRNNNMVTKMAGIHLICIWFLVIIGSTILSKYIDV